MRSARRAAYLGASPAKPAPRSTRSAQLAANASHLTCITRSSDLPAAAGRATARMRCLPVDCSPHAEKVFAWSHRCKEVESG
ncbi:hypothetical protein APY30_02570 [Xanthomonas citri pv. malvacearum]|nr:hypothetical protein APY29_02745 [Xanthomonas citri pv. malvacearum]ASN07975.1 hypothetical protein APY30_02570 [Xanthomonas citri pv. malvacearum]OOW97663.1 hypothetical protein Xmlv_05795 [Xanthomonas citri pv. malvacearum]